jgi:hypothetical protein
MAAIYSNGSNRWNILGFNITKRDALSSVHKISMVELDNFVASCRQAIDNLLTSWEQAVRTHPDDKLLKQHCYNLQSLLQLVRFYVCI